MHFPTIWRSKFTDLVNSKKKKSIFGKKIAVDKSAWIIACLLIYEMLYTIWYHLCNLKNVKNTQEGVLVLVKLQALACKLTKSNTHSWVFSTFLMLCKWHQITLRISYTDIISTQWKKSCSKLTMSRFVWSCSQLTLTVSKLS